MRIRKSTFVVVPAYNEAGQIGSTLRRLLDAHFEVVVVDDGSSDGTWDVVNRLPVHRLRHPTNLGQGAALQTGMTYALQQGAEFIVHFDADGQHQAEDIDSLLEPLSRGEADVVLGSRFLNRDHQGNVPAIKRLLLRGGVWVNGLLTGLWLTDAHNGFRALTRSAASQIHLEENGFTHASEILNQIRSRRLQHLERPTAILYTDYSKQKGQSVWNAFNIVFDLLLRKVFK
jgi:glycosyltransferase involved in cell wall biosynthesis